MSSRGFYAGPACAGSSCRGPHVDGSAGYSSGPGRAGGALLQEQGHSLMGASFARLHLVLCLQAPGLGSVCVCVGAGVYGAPLPMVLYAMLVLPITLAYAR
jgi:hypothetical protein